MSVERSMIKDRPAPEGGGSASPCTGECVIDPDTGFCEGCLRTMKEIRRWPYLDDEQKREILARLPERRQGGLTADDD